jgi:hypothetical protein
MTLSRFNIGVASNNNEHARHAVDMGVDVGSPDLLWRMRHGGVTYFLYMEMKRAKGVLSPDQIEWNEEFDKHFVSDNCERCVAYGLKEAQNLVKSWIEKILQKSIDI